MQDANEQSHDLNRLEPVTTSENAPKLASVVRLVGQMSGTGFEQQPWLIQRDQRFIQVTELLYRLLETIDGNHRVDEIARQISDSTSWELTGKQVQQLIRTKLVPLGLIEVGNNTAGVQHHVSTPAPSPLSVYMRMRVIKPHVIEPATRVLLHLYRLPLLVPLLCGFAVAEWWLYGQNDVAETLSAALVTPGSLLAVIALVIVAGLFHELGHAAALAYAGGKVRGMGVGLYLMYPAFYTDVTDVYRLGRAARIRTDLGGLYFHSVACLIITGLAIWTQKPWLLLAVVLINADMVRQFIPFVKLDGYWLLADLTGIPDFFSQMGPFVRSIAAPTGRNTGQLPALKPLARAIFAIYIVAVVPALAYMLFLLVKNLPRVVETAGAAAQQQGTALLIAAQNAQFVTSLLLSLTILLMTASVIGMFCIVALSIVPPLVAAWRWTHGVPRRLVTVGAGTAVLASSVGVLWYPDAKRIYNRLAAPSSLDQAAELLDRAARNTASAASLRAELEGGFGPDHFTGNIVLKRPNFARIEVSGEGGIGEIQIVSDGAELHTFFPAQNNVVDSSPGPDGRYVRAYLADQVDLFFRPDLIRANARRREYKYVGPLNEDGETYDVVDRMSRGQKTQTTRYLIARSDGLIHGITVSQPGGQTMKWARLRNVKLNGTTAASDFRWARPANAGAVALPSGLALPVPGAAASGSKE